MKKTIITFIGTGSGKRTSGKPDYEYKKTKYLYPDQSGIAANPTPFSYQALAELIQPDLIHVFGTRNSMWSTLLLDSFLRVDKSIENDNEALRLYSEVDDQIKSQGIQPPVLADLQKIVNAQQTTSHNLHLHGLMLDEQSMWEFYTVLIEIARESGDLYLDITHGFRHIPLIAFTAIIFISAMFPETVRIKGLYSVAWEAKKDPIEVDEPAPLLNLLPAFEMVKWFHGGRDLLKYGDYRDFTEFLRPIDEALAARFKSVGQSLQVNAINGIKNKINRLFKKLNQDHIKNHPALGRIVPMINDQFQPVRSAGKEWETQFQLARWYYQHEMYQQAMTTLRESLITKFIEDEGLNLHILSNRNLENNDMKTKFITYLKSNGWYLRYNKCRRIRNRINHGWTLDRNGAMVEQTITEIGGIFSFFENAFRAKGH